MFRDAQNEYFRQFATSLKTAISRYKQVDDKKFLNHQKKQVETLVRLEKKFRQALIEHPEGEKVYEEFITLICDKNRNILTARPYFRERQTVFTEEISLALKTKNTKKLKKFHFNYQFVQFVLKAREWGPDSPITQIADKLHAAREELITMNMPLAISRARIFYNKTPKSHLELMDFIAIACEGLIAGIDKFCLPYSPVFRSVAIWRMTGNFIEEYGLTMVHFYPSDKRKIYRANKVVGKHMHVDLQTLTDEVNRDTEEIYKTNPSEIADLMAASSCISMDSMSQDAEGRPTDRFLAPDESQPDNQVEYIQVVQKLGESMKGLNTLERKVLTLFGVDVSNF